MARHEADREDLMEEARALEPRVELQCTAWETPLVIGRRRDDFLSVYLGQDRVYHFDSDGGLRRAYVEGYLYRSAGATLTRIRRERTVSETNLMTQDLAAEELREFLAAMKSSLETLALNLKAHEYRILRQVPEAGDPLVLLAPLLGRVLQASPLLSPALK